MCIRDRRIDAFLTGLLAQMGAEARPVIRVDENGTYQVELVGRELGGLIGRRGETLDAIQQLTGYAVNHGQSKRCLLYTSPGCRQGQWCGCRSPGCSR